MGCKKKLAIYSVNNAAIYTIIGEESDIILYYYSKKLCGK